MITAGHIVLGASSVLFIFGLLSIFASALLPEFNNKVVDAIVHDDHYKYFAIFIIPTTSYFVIANWVGWQYYRNS